MRKDRKMNCWAGFRKKLAKPGISLQNGSNRRSRCPGQGIAFEKKSIALRPYDTGKAKRYEVPAERTEEVSLTSLTGRSKSKKKNN
jgi:hypothetical protein